MAEALIRPVAVNVATGDLSYSGSGVPIGNGVVLMTNDGAPTNAVAGTGYGTAEAGALYVKTVGKVLYLNVGDAVLPDWTADGGTLRSGAGAPTNGVTNGVTNDFYSNTVAYGNDPLTGWYRCTNGTSDTWVAFTGTVLADTGTPVDGVAGTGVRTAGPGSLLVDYDAPGIYQQDGTLALPTWSAA